MAALEELSTISINQYFGLALDTKLLFNGGQMKLRESKILNGVVERLIRDNKSIKFYGIKISLFAEALNEDECSEIFTFFSDWCEEKRMQFGLALIFDIARDRRDFEHIMTNEHLRMKHGDIKRQFAGALSH